MREIGHSGPVSTPPPPYGPPPGSLGGPPPGQPLGLPLSGPPRPQKYRPSAGWLVLGTGLVMAAFAIGIAMFVWLLVGLLDFDAIVAADGQPHDVSVGTDRDRMLWMDSTAQSCDVVDLDSGQPVELRAVDEEFSRSDANGDFEGLLRFDPGSGHLEITCTQTDGGPEGSVLVSALPRIDSAAIGFLVAIVVPAFLGLVGLVVILWTGVLWSLRPPRPRGV
mgnify:CR=1 FL=1